MSYRLWRKTTFAVIVCTTAIFCRPSLAADQVHYIVSLTDPERHLVQVTIEIPPGNNSRELQLPVWNALYQIRDFSQYINWIRAEDPSGAALPLVQLNKSRWRISGAERGAVVRYEIFADNPGPYGAQVNSHHAFFNLAEILCYIEGERSAPVEVDFRNLPSFWKLATPLPGQGNAFSAKDYDQLVDSPVEIGSFGEQDFEVSSARFRVVVDTDPAQPILDKIVPVVTRVVTTELGWMNECPFQSYMFIYHFSNARGDGGMEHAYSTAISLPERDITPGFEHFASITAHEFFHLWNVKRIRPQSLEPVDYTKENYTPALWFSEGVDSTVAEYVQLRAGLVDEPRYLSHLGFEITELETRPAHLTQSAEQSSINAWLEKYPYYNLPERSISYYNKGELLGVLLDLKMRDATDDKVSFQDLLRRMNEHYAKQGKFFPDSQGVREAAESLSHADLAEFFQKYVNGTSEIPWDSFFSRVGLHVTSSEITFADPGFEASQNFDQSPTVVKVEPGSNAEGAGLQPGDVIVEMNGQRQGRDFQRTIVELTPGDALRLVISRQGQQHKFEWTLGGRRQKVYRMENVPDLSPQQKARRAKWLFGNTAGHSPTK